jgi:hypothetical protein
MNASYPLASRLARAGLVLAGACAGLAAGPRLVEQTRVNLRIQPLTATAIEPSSDGLLLEVPVGGEVSGAMTLGWPDAKTLVRVRLEAAEIGRGPTWQRVRLVAHVGLPDGASERSERTLTIDESLTALFEIHRRGEQALTLAVEGTLERETVVARRSALGPPVQFQLEIERVEGGQAIPLETNVLNTFAGEPVGYEFRLADPGEGDALRVQLYPLRVTGTVLELELEVSGTLSGAAEATVLSRREKWMTNAGARSSLTVEIGDPPAGYRFAVTPRF